MARDRDPCAGLLRLFNHSIGCGAEQALSPLSGLVRCGGSSVSVLLPQKAALKEKPEIDNVISQLIISDNKTFIAEKYKYLLNTFHNEAVYLPISYELDLALVRKDRVKNFQFGNMVTEFMLHTLEPADD